MQCNGMGKKWERCIGGLRLMDKCIVTTDRKTERIAVEFTERGNEGVHTDRGCQYNRTSEPYCSDIAVNWT